MSITPVTTRDVADAYAKGRKDERAALDELRGMAGMGEVIETLRYEARRSAPYRSGRQAAYREALTALLLSLAGET